MRKAVFLDRDGVINRKAPEGEYITSVAEFGMLPGVPSEVSKLNVAGYVVLIVTNQRGIARNKLSIGDLDAIHATMLYQFREAGAAIDGVYCCPHDIDSGCSCRKPRPGMLTQAASEHNVTLAGSWLVGDSSSDIGAGRSAGCRTVLLADTNAENSGADIVAADLAGAVARILEFDGRLCRANAVGNPEKPR